MKMVTDIGSKVDDLRKARDQPEAKAPSCDDDAGVQLKLKKPVRSQGPPHQVTTVSKFQKI